MKTKLLFLFVFLTLPWPLKSEAVTDLDLAFFQYEQLTQSPPSVQELIIQYSKDFGIEPDLPLAIALCESGYSAAAKNPHSTASGVFQFIAGTWANTAEGKEGLSVFDPDANVRAAIRHLSTRGPSPWSSSQQCWEKQTKQ